MDFFEDELIDGFKISVFEKNLNVIFSSMCAQQDDRWFIKIDDHLNQVSTFEMPADPDSSTVIMYSVPITFSVR